MPELKEVFNGVLAITLNMAEAEISSLLDEEGNPKADTLEAIKTKFTDKVRAERAKESADRQAQYHRGLKEKGQEFEKALREAGVEIGDATGADAVAKIREHIEANTKPSELDDDKVKNSKLYRQMEKEFQDKVKAKEQEFAKAIGDRDAKEKRDSNLRSVKQRAEELKSVLKPVLPEDPNIAKNQLRLLNLDIEAIDYEAEDDGTIVLKDKEGKRLEKANGHPMSLDEFLEQAIRGNFPVQVSDQKRNAGDPGNGSDKKGAGAVKKPASRDELTQQLHAINSDQTLSHQQKAEQFAALKEVAADLMT